MKKAFIFLLSYCAVSLVYADSCQNPLPQVTMQLTAEQWVTTQTAKVIVVLDASLNKNQLGKAQDNFQNALKKIAAEGVWHITEFSRSPTKTNLEQLHAVAEARLPESALGGIRERAKAQSSEGETYTVQDIFYTPSLGEVSAAQAQVRSQIYNQAKAELDRINAVYSKPAYSLYNINFVNTAPTPGPNMMAKMMTTMAPETSPMVMSQQITQDALVIFAAPSDALCRK